MPDYAERELAPGVHTLVLDTLLYLDGDASPLYTLAADASLEQHGRALTEPERAALYNRLLSHPTLGSVSGRLGDQVTIAELREVVRRLAVTLDHRYDWE